MSRLETLKKKLDKRIKQRQRQWRKWRKTGKAGHEKAFIRHSKAVKYLKWLIKREQKRIESLRPKSGTGKLGGTSSIIDNEVIPVARKFGAPATSRKRPADHPLSIGNPGSDHNEANTTADAIDFGTYSGDELARAIAAKLGINGYTTGTYGNYYIERAGKTFRVQILWAVEGHYDHVHVGIRLA
jgi:hypothetical protein